MSAHAIQVLHDRAVDGLAVISALALGVSLTTTLQLVQLFAGLVSITAGCFAIRYYIKKANNQ